MRYAALGVLTLALLGLAAAWRWTPLSERLQLASLLDAMQQLQHLPFAPAAVLAGYVVAGLCVVPITLVVIVTAMAFDPVPAAAYGVAGSLLSAAVTFLIGAWLGRDAVRRLAGERINRISRRFADGGILAVAMLRLFPFVPFTVVNLVAGASPVTMSHFLIGTLLAEAPGIFLIVALVHQVAGAIREPSMGAFATLSGLLMVVIGLALVLKRRFGKREA
jgi:phospholipase D1/2